MPKKDTSILFFLTPAIGWGILICYFSLMPSKQVPNMLKSVQDFVLHFSIYTILATLSFFGVNKFNFVKTSLNNVWRIIMYCFVLGFVIELIQGYAIAGRQFEWKDVFFNTLGASMVFGLNKFAPATKL